MQDGFEIFEKKKQQSNLVDTGRYLTVSHLVHSSSQKL